MEQMRIGTSIDIKEHLTILPLTQTVCNLYYFESTFFSKLYILCSSAYKRYGFETINL